MGRRDLRKYFEQPSVSSPDETRDDRRVFSADIAPPQFPPHPYYLHTLVFRADIRKLEFISEAGVFAAGEVDQVDHRGNTPLILAVKMCRLAQEYRRIVVLLLGMGADPKAKDASGWTALDISIASGDQQISSLLFTHLHQLKLSRLRDHWASAHASLARLPDFYLEIKWEFDSSYIPLIKKFGPHDLCRLWKVGSELRLDTTLVSWRKLVSKRRKLSLVFRDCDRSQASAPLSHAHLVLVNHSKSILIDLMESFDVQEVRMTLRDMLHTDPAQGEITVSECEAKPCRSWLGLQSTFRCGNYVGKKYEVQLQAQVEYAKRGHRTPPIRESEYFGDVRGTDLQQGDFEHRPLNLCADRDDKFMHFARKVKANVWVSDEFPISLKDFIPVLEVLGAGNALFAKLRQFLSEELISSFSETGFPVKMDIPLTMSLRAVVSFPKFELVTNASDLFALPDYRVESRRVGQKTMTSPRKRMMLVSMLL